MSLSTRQQLDSPRIVISARPFSLFLWLALFAYFTGSTYAQDLTALETAIRSGTSEQKRDALFQIRNLRSETASKAAVPALKDTDPIVRATAAGSVVFLSKAEAVAALTPGLGDKDAFVRTETVYALGTIESSDVAPALIELLRREKDLEVRSAAAAALGQTGNPSAIPPLITILMRSPKEDEEFIRRAAARSVGQIAQITRTAKERVVTPQSFLPEKFKDLEGKDLAAEYPTLDAAVSTLTAVLRNTRESDDTRREAAFALGAIGNRDSVTFLQTYTSSPDPYLAEIAREALAKIEKYSPAN